MKSKTLLIFLVAGTFTMTLGMWAYYSMEGSLAGKDIFMFSVLLLVAAFAIFLGIIRYRSERRGEPGEDEMSRRILQKAGATSFYVSLYFWLVLSYLMSERQIETETAIGTGIIGMSIIYALSWVYHRVKGLQE